MILGCRKCSRKSLDVVSLPIVSYKPKHTLRLAHGYSTITQRKDFSSLLRLNFNANLNHGMIHNSRMYSWSMGGPKKSLSTLISVTDPESFDNQTTSQATKIIEECLRVRQSIQDLNDRVKGPLEKTSQRNTILPFVFLLGKRKSMIQTLERQHYMIIGDIIECDKHRAMI